MRKVDRTLLILGILLFPLAGCIKATTSPSTSSSSAVECMLNQATTAPCTASTTGSVVTTTMGSNITSWTNGSGTTTVSAVIPNGFYSSKTVSLTDPLLIASNIKSGVTVFGVTGTDPGLASNAMRTLNTTQLSASGESITYAGLRLPAASGYTYREIPKITKDDDGTDETNVTYVNRAAPILWTGRTCGTGNTIDDKISDCAVKLGAEASWSGTARGNAGQATWSIVMRIGDCGSTAPNQNCQEVWRDNRTRLLWSSRVTESVNWCKASGNNNIGGNAGAEADPSGFCDNIANQNVAGKAISACYDDNGATFATTGIANGAGRGGLTITTTPAVAWRLPTIQDYRQAEVDGIRYVLPDMGNNAASAPSTYEWTTTVLSTNRAEAWVFDTYLGGTTTNARNSVTINATTIGARCVGR